jgi:hypothetical protein
MPVITDQVQFQALKIISFCFNLMGKNMHTLF